MAVMYIEHRHAMLASRTTNLWRLALWIAVCLGGGLLIGYAFRPDEWFRALERPSFAPPDWLFAPVWATLYVLMAHRDVARRALPPHARRDQGAQGLPHPARASTSPGRRSSSGSTRCTWRWA